ncbi:thioredoxin domain-containing protein [Megasphaera hexanoica]|uniref:Glutaredoxin n=1 Tax=Megasphaera hexanoica TaxID=1675036 RepID=A0A848C126_9FIRM|nr:MULTISPECIES: thioredoxin domain-containing protein [Megasphaera]MCI5532731.1 glutaredoxin [Caecibacter massiliensis]HAM04890.1 glutaredoxin [Megasphaera sp.]AXB82484.1 glutaredoxin [Megasphaera hexanoica]KUH55689.1 glutaredoxin [Megasphaera sp. DJF_B143]MDY2905108.1 glutaredoxin [Caecibacter massiliensis]
MKKITAFYLTGCPYCANAKKALKDLIAENPEYGKVEIDWIEETQHPDLVAGHQYYYDPSMFDGFHKLYEAQPGESFEETKANVRRVLDYALKY